MTDIERPPRGGAGVPSGDGPAAEALESAVASAAPDLGVRGGVVGTIPGEVPSTGRPGSLWHDAWHELRRNPMFIGCGLLIAVLLVMTAVPGLFTIQDPRLCRLSNSLLPVSGQHWFGTDLQGCDVYSRTVHGTRASVLVGVLTTLAVSVFGGLVGAFAGFYLGKLDALLSRVMDVFFALPLILGAVVILSIFPARGILSVVFVLAVLSWPIAARIMRASVISARSQDYVQAARALGASDLRILRRHILPNAVAPVIVVGTINLGVFIAVEATLTFLGIGLQDPTISWGIMIEDARSRFLVAPGPLLFPAAFLAVTVLSFILLGDAVRDALDPKLR
jgi:oligopeptide transport system permease protein